MMILNAENAKFYLVYADDYCFQNGTQCKNETMQHNAININGEQKLLQHVFFVCFSHRSN